MAVPIDKLILLRIHDVQLEIFPPRRSVVDKAEENILLLLLVLLRAMPVQNFILFAEFRIGYCNVTKS